MAQAFSAMIIGKFSIDSKVYHLLTELSFFLQGKSYPAFGTLQSLRTIASSSSAAGESSAAEWYVGDAICQIQFEYSKLNFFCRVTQILANPIRSCSWVEPRCLTVSLWSTSLRWVNIPLRKFLFWLFKVLFLTFETFSSTLKHHRVVVIPTTSSSTIAITFRMRWQCFSRDRKYRAKFSIYRVKFSPRKCNILYNLQFSLMLMQKVEKH